MVLLISSLVRLVGRPLQLTIASNKMERINILIDFDKYIESLH